MLDLDVGEVGFIEDIRQIANRFLVDDRIFAGHIRPL
ncbi:Putative periplasmic substrate-binding protein, ABC-type [Brucella melitensis NI]|nr:Putative periplasmic substrate-binding protein, ABC-type [Brucella melitensis NI]